MPSIFCIQKFCYGFTGLGGKFPGLSRNGPMAPDTGQLSLVLLFVSLKGLGRTSKLLRAALGMRNAPHGSLHVASAHVPGMMVKKHGGGRRR